MGLFKKKSDDTAERDLHRNLAAEISELQETLRVRTGQLREADERLGTVRSEYDQTVSSLMRIKKEINDAREEQGRLSRINDGIHIQIEEGRRTLRDSHKDVEMARRTTADLAGATAELEEKSALGKRMDESLEEAQKRLDGINSEIMQRERRRVDLQRTAGAEAQQDAAKKMAATEARLAKSEAEREDLAEELAARVRMVDNLQERLAAAEARLRESASRPPSDRGVMEAATATVALLRSRLNATVAELEKVRRQLDEERARPS